MPRRSTAHYGHEQEEEPDEHCRYLRRGARRAQRWTLQIKARKGYNEIETRLRGKLEAHDASAPLQEFLTEVGPGDNGVWIRLGCCQAAIQLGTLGVGELKKLGGLANAIPEVFRKLNSFGDGEVAEIDLWFAHPLNLGPAQIGDKVEQKEVGLPHNGHAILLRTNVARARGARDTYDASVSSNCLLGRSAHATFIVTTK